MRNWSNVILYFLLSCYCMFGIELIDKYWFNRQLFGTRLGLTMAVVFISAYPIFGWKLDSGRGLWVRWSFDKWALFGAGAGLVTILVDAFSHAVVRHFST